MRNAEWGVRSSIAQARFGARTNPAIPHSTFRIDPLRCAPAPRKLPCPSDFRPLTTEDRVTLDEAKAALQRGRHLVLVLPPDVEQAAAVWELVSAPAVIVC